MDTSETYIKMRRAAIPDLGEGKPPSLPLDGDSAWFDVAVFVDRHGSYYYSTINLQPIGEAANEMFQLERQDQLQEMVFEHPGDNYNKSMYPTLESLYLFACTMYTKSAPPWSMEQLWLAFVMKEKYNKVWNGENWHAI